MIRKKTLLKLYTTAAKAKMSQSPEPRRALKTNINPVIDTDAMRKNHCVASYFIRFIKLYIIVISHIKKPMPDANTCELKNSL